MIDLTSLAGLQLFFNEENCSVTIDDCITCQQRKITLQEIINALLNRYIKYPEVVYTQHQVQQYEDSDINFDIVTMPHGLLGIEYNKTHIYGSNEECGRVDSIIQLLRGSLTVLLQKNILDDDPYAFEKKVERVLFVNMKEGDKLVIPTGYVYTFINISNSAAIFSKIAGKTQTSIDYSSIAKERGLAYYVISKNARVEKVPNPKYKILNGVQEMTTDQYLTNVDHSLREIILDEFEAPLFEIFRKRIDSLRTVMKI